MLHNIVGITGRFGSGKTLYAVEQGVRLANKFRKQLVFNFDVNEEALREYCRVKGYAWFASCGKIRRIELIDDLMQVWKYKNSVLVWDEGGVFANSRAWASLPKDFLKNLFQVRHLNIHILLVFQFHEQVDRQIREVIQEWVVCQSWGYYDNALGLPRIYARRAYHFDPEKFLRLESDPQKKGNIFIPWLWANKKYYRVLTLASAVASFRNIYQDLAFLAIYLIFGREIKRVKHSSDENRLFSVFSSKRIVGDIVTAKDLRPFFTATDYEAWVLRGAMMHTSNPPARGVAPKKFKLKAKI